MTNGIVHAVCVSSEKGTPKGQRASVVMLAGQGIEGDAHAGDGHRQVSILPLERIEEFRRKGATVAFGAFGENVVAGGLDWDAVRVGDRMLCGPAVLEVTQLGKECHDRCGIFEKMGECIMPKYGMFARVVRGGRVRPGEEMRTLAARRAALLTVSDKAARGEREDLSGPAMRDIVESRGMEVAVQETVPDDAEAIARALIRYSDELGAGLVLTSGGTGFAARDVTPEATLRVIERACPGIPEAMRVLGMQVSRRAMLSRGVAGIRGRTLIVNLPGSPKAVRESLGFVIDELEHGLAILAGDANECGKEA